MYLWQALFLGILQGISELFPVSSLGQTILIPALLAWPPSTTAGGDFLAFLVLLHLATAIALLIYFWKDWLAVARGLLGGISRKKLIYDRDSKLAWLLICGSIIVGIVGLLAEHKLRVLFADPQKAWIVAAILIVNGFIMMLADVLKRRASSRLATAAGKGADDPANDAPAQRKNAEDLSLTHGAAVGAAQSLALVPGISRSGVTIAAGLLAGLSYEEACRFSFMLATPVIALASLKKVPDLFHPENRHLLGVAIPAALAAGITAFISTHFLMRYFRHNRMSPFGWYCIVFGALALYILKSR